MSSRARLFKSLTEARLKNAMTKNLHAWIDETGEKGLLYRLNSGNDASFGLLCAICVPAEREIEFREKIRPLFERMHRLIGNEGKVHIADAYGGNTDRTTEANEIRQELFEIILSCELAILYEARRLRVARKSFLMNQEIQARARADQSERYAFPNQIDQDRLEVDLAIGLTLKLDVFAYWVGADHLDMYFDRMSRPIFEEILSEINKRTSSGRTVIAKGFDKIEKKPVKREWQLDLASDGAPSTLLTFRSAQMVDPVDERIFAIDVVAGSLGHHLQKLAATDHLNLKSATKGWVLHERVAASPEPGPEEFV